MIFVNGKEITPGKFPDGTASLRIDLIDQDRYFFIVWKYDGDHECMTLWHIVKHIQDKNSFNVYIELYMPYIPNARMDRVHHDDEVFTLKHFASFINSLRFDAVTVEDPHSNVAPALFDRIHIRSIDRFVNWALAEIRQNEPSCVCLCYPDVGAAKRYADELPYASVTCNKRRDWNTGKILSLELNDPEMVKGHSILIVDDICSKGGTFIRTAKALKEAGANKVYLCVTHCENTIFDGDILTSDLIDHAYTTDSIYRGKSNKISVYELIDGSN